MTLDRKHAMTRLLTEWPAALCPPDGRLLL